MIRLITFLGSCLVVLSAVRADDLDIMVDETVSAEVRAEAQDRLAAAEFRSIMPRLAGLIHSHQIEFGLRSGIASPCDKPEKLTERARIGCKLRQLWRLHMAAAKADRQDVELMLDLLENPSVGEGKRLVIWDLTTRIQIALDHYQWSFLPTLQEVMQRLERFVRDTREPDHIRRVLLVILLRHGDQNKYLDLALELSDTGATSLGGSDLFRHCTEALRPDKLSPENRRKYLHRAFSLLEQVDDGHSGHGYFLACQLGGFVGVPREGQGSFVPDSRLPEYRGPHGLREQFFQDTVSNACKWWEENKATF
jgi:hypothetical protein